MSMAGAVSLAVLALVLVYGVLMVKSLSMVRSAAMNLPWMYINAVVPLAALLMLPHQLKVMLHPQKPGQDGLEPKSPPSAERD